MTTQTPDNELWPTRPTVDQLNALNPGTLGEVLGMRFTEVGPDYLRMAMPVDARTKQPAGLLHGGASAALAETIGSVASNCVIDRERQAAVGLELNCSHLRGKREGEVYATCRAIRVGRSVHVWDIRIADEAGREVCACRLTVTILSR